MGWFERWNADKCKATLKVAAAHAKLLRPKLESSTKKNKREIAKLLQDGKEPLARIRAEQALQDQRMEAALEILGMHCELLHTRMAYIDSEKECPRDLMSAVCTILFCQTRVDVPELTEVKNQFQLKYGKEWVKTATDRAPTEAHQSLIEYLSVEPPPAGEITGMLQQVALENGLDWKPEEPQMALQAGPAAAAAPSVGSSPDLQARLAALRGPAVPAAASRGGYAASAAPVVGPAPSAGNEEVARMKAQIAALEAQLQRERDAASAALPAAAPSMQSSLPPPPSVGSPPPKAAKTSGQEDVSLEARLAALRGTPAECSMPPPPQSQPASMAPDPEAASIAARLAELQATVDQAKHAQGSIPPAPPGQGAEANPFSSMPPAAPVASDVSMPPAAPGALDVSMPPAMPGASGSEDNPFASMPPPAPGGGNPFDESMAPAPPLESTPPPPPSGAVEQQGMPADPKMEDLWQRFQNLKEK